MPAKILSTAVDDDINAEVKWVLTYRCCESIVAHDQSAAVVRERCDDRKICDAEQRIGGRLNPYQPCMRGQRIFHLARIAEIHKFDRHRTLADTLAQLLEHAVVRPRGATT